MLSRKTVKTLANVYNEEFKKSSRRLHKQININDIDSFYDFLYEHDYDAWLLNIVKTISIYNRREIKEFIMHLHTGETVAMATKDWTWQQRSKLGEKILRDLAEDILIFANIPESYVGDSVSRMLRQLMSELELDGYIFRDERLYYSEATVFDAENEEGILAKLIQDLMLDNQDVIKHHIELSGTHYIDERWDDSIANSRKYLESVLQEIAAKNYLIQTEDHINPSIYSSPFKTRDYLEKQGIIEPKEKEAISKVYGLLSETGCHPYIAQKDQARLMRYLALTFAQFALLRFQGSLSISE